MEIDQLRQDINDLLENIIELSNNYSDNRSLSSLEVSYVLSKVNKMQEALILLKFLTEHQELISKKPVEAPVVPPVVEEITPEPIEVVVEIEAETQEPTASEVVAGQEEQVIEEIAATIHNEGNETIAEAGEQEETPQIIANIEALPIGKIVDALTLNDRYLYANELFEKDMNAFNELVKTIDACSAIEEAKTIMMEFEEKWDAENEHVISFFGLVERRFM